MSRCVCSFKSPISILSIDSGGWKGFVLFQEIITSSFFSTLNSIFYCHAQSRIVSRSRFSFTALTTSFSTTENNDVSSANRLRSQLKQSQRSLICTRKRRGPSTEPCGTPARTFFHSEVFLFNTTFCFLPIRRLFGNASMLPEIQLDLSL